ncbi:xanthine dehydrogenase family protein molybdopterin-binding subunit [Alphaproteobacteria bacterium]|nr:xanthine dehydrogenase family protein molybdopterin-binding subunit [Alphaproteobacteria bacterium]
MKFGIGQPIKRVEDTRLLTGNGLYTDDISIKNQSYMYVLRSPHANAKILKINYEEALKTKGLIKIINWEDIKRLSINDMKTTFLVKNRDGKEMTDTPRHILAKDYVRYVGDPILAIIADSLEIAEDVAEKILINYEEYESLTDITLAVKKNTISVRSEVPNNICFDWELGNKEKALENINSSNYKINIELVNNRLIPNPMECRSTIGIYDDINDEYTLYCSSQGVHSLKRKLSNIFNKTENKFHVITKDVGGGFGMKIFNYPEYILSLAASNIVKRPVKWKASRTESFLSDIHGRDHFSKATLGIGKDYKFKGLVVETLANMGAYMSDFAVFIPTYAGTGMLTGCYDIPTAYANVKGIYTNTGPTDAYRGAGRPEAAYLIERLVDKAAMELAISPIEIREINLIEKNQMPYKTALGHTYDSGDFKKNLIEAKNKSKYDSFKERKEYSLKKGFLRGIGISTYIEACGGGGPEFAKIIIGKNGNVTVKIGTQSNGQGHETMYAQIVSEILGIDISLIQIMQGNSKEIKKGAGTGGSRSTPVGGSALKLATEGLIKKIKVVLSEKFETNSSSIEYKNGIFTFKNKSLTLAEISNFYSDDNNQLEEEGTWAPTQGTFTYPNGTHICELEVNKETGKVNILNYYVVDDFGKVINPLLLEGQVHGGIVQGIGQALFEETLYDENGQLISGSFMDYAIPRASDVPDFQFSYNEILCKNNLLGVKGAGEAGAIGAPPAVINALCNALNISHIDMPAKPEKLWKIINNISS